ncbi:MAG TPA: very short patch repair endonuclease [Candidatus Saccharimonadales bacterium]|nr:very short patch repair endonuclease [Candidatus Saccharimonadales bacterium]
MADVFSVKKRSEIMSRIRSKDTVAERIVFKYLRQHKIYFQKHYSKVPGKPDVALPRKKKAVFVDGDFWHGRDYKRLFRTRPKSDYWIGKIKYNMERDLKNRKFLKDNDWQILTVWETDIKRKKTQNEELEKIAKFLKT